MGEGARGCRHNASAHAKVGLLIEVQVTHTVGHQLRNCHKSAAPMTPAASQQFQQNQQAAALLT